VQFYHLRSLVNKHPPPLLTTTEAKPNNPEEPAPSSPPPQQQLLITSKDILLLVGDRPLQLFNQKTTTKEPQQESHPILKPTSTYFFDVPSSSQYLCEHSTLAPTNALNLPPGLLAVLFSVLYLFSPLS
jgi:hypothetical protein